MTTPSLHQQTGLSINVFKPTITRGVSYVPTGRLMDNLAEQIDSYNQTLTASGGYWQAGFTINDRIDKCEDWLNEGLGWHIETYSPALDRVWEGFVNRIILSVGGFTVTRGPLLNVANRVSVSYSRVDRSVSPTCSGIKFTTAVTNNTASQDAYGIIEKKLSIGNTVPANAAQIQATYLIENAWPETSKSLSSGGAQQPFVKVECLGYIHFLKAYIYNQIINTGTMALDLKIQAILVDPNGLFSTDYSQITANPFLVKQYEDNDSTAWAVIKDLVSVGDAASVRYTLGMYNDRIVEYTAMPTTLTYQQRLADPAQSIETILGTPVEYYEVRPAQWLFFPDFLTGLTPTVGPRNDPRALFIENVKYIAPATISINGSKVGTLNQQLAQLGLLGI